MNNTYNADLTALARFVSEMADALEDADLTPLRRAFTHRRPTSPTTRPGQVGLPSPAVAAGLLAGRGSVGTGGLTDPFGGLDHFGDHGGVGGTLGAQLGNIGS
jgi:hypothetical protein